ncbi:MAG: Wadjet anti-phage system protein JetD domain-containing protein [Phocaeicola sp.]
MNITIEQAKLLKELSEGKKVPLSRLKARIFQQLIQEQVLLRQKESHGWNIYTDHPQSLLNYLYNHYIRCTLDEYIERGQAAPSRSNNIRMSGDSKLKETELWQGFYFKVSEPIHAQWQGRPLTLLPYPEGIPVFMPQPETLSLPEDVTVVMIENSENFLKIETQLPLFQGLQCFFVSFYPREQHSYFIEWLQKQPNNYVHYGDFDFAGIHIYQSQYKKYVSGESRYLVPSGLLPLFRRYGKRALYNNQLSLQALIKADEPGISELLEIIKREHKGLEQEIFNDLFSEE